MPVSGNAGVGIDSLLTEMIDKGENPHTKIQKSIIFGIELSISS